MLSIKFKLIDGNIKAGKLAFLNRVIFVVFFILSFWVAPAFAQSENTILKQGDNPIRLSSPNEVSKLTKWKRFNFPKGNFSILFPDTPGLHLISKQPPQGFSNQYRYYWQTSDEQLYFEAQVLELLSDVSFNLERGVEGFKQQQKSKNATLLSEKNMQVNSLPAVDFLYQIPDEPEPVLGYTRIMFCGYRIYTLMGAGTKSQNDLSDVVNKFFDSFSPIGKCEIQITSDVDTKQSKTGSGLPAASRRYIRGPRGGCYYINNKGNKIYVDRNLCR